MSQPLVILGTGGGASELLDVIDAINAIRPTWQPTGYLDDTRPRGSRHFGIEVLGPLCEAGRFVDCAFANAIGSDKSYRRLPEIVATTGLAAGRFPTLVHPGASVSRRARLGSGVRVNFGTWIGGETTVGNHVTICPGAFLGHDVVIEDFTILSPGATINSSVHVGRACYLGAGSVILQKVRIGAGALVGIGAVVLNDVEPEAVVFGNPARVLQRPNS
jgi:sugar O-acyltransferase (sialic acid O-acetyltransferase NeuD family)